MFSPSIPAQHRGADHRDRQPTDTATWSFRRCIVGVESVDGLDNRAAALDAIALARMLGCADRLILAHGCGTMSFVPEIPGDTRLHDAVHALRDLATGAGVDAELVALPEAPPAEALVRLAGHRGADLVVLGVSHHGPAGRAVFGDVARTVLRDGGCAVGIAPRGFAQRPNVLRAIGVPSDRRPGAYAALRLAESLARATGARITRLERVPDDPPADAGVDLLVLPARARRRPLPVHVGGAPRRIIHHPRLPILVVPTTPPARIVRWRRTSASSTTP